MTVHHDEIDWGAGARSVRLTRASTIVMRPVKWLWTNLLALGVFALLGGREGIGKSICAYTLAADLTRGRVPGACFGIPRDVIVAATEDSREHTIVPRLVAAGADLDRVHLVDVVTADDVDAALSLPRDLAATGRFGSRDEVGTGHPGPCALAPGGQSRPSQRRRRAPRTGADRSSGRGHWRHMAGSHPRQQEHVQ